MNEPFEIFPACLHQKFKSKFNKKYNAETCKKCGVLSIEHVIKYIFKNQMSFTKPKEYNNPTDIDQNVILIRIKDELKEKIILDKDICNADFIEKRPKIINYLSKLCQNLEYTKETFNIALTYVDKLLINNKLNNLKYDLAVIGCLILSVKFVEKNASVPDYSKFRKCKKECYSPSEISNAERQCLIALNYNLGIFSSYEILKFFLINGVVTSLDEEQIINFYEKSITILQYVIEDVRSLDFSLTELAIACLLTAGQLTNLKKQIKNSLANVYGFEINNFAIASFVIISLYKFKNKNEIHNLTNLYRSTNNNITYKKQNIIGKKYSYIGLQEIYLADLMDLDEIMIDKNIFYNYQTNMPQKLSKSNYEYDKRNFHQNTVCFRSHREINLMSLNKIPSDFCPNKFSIFNKANGNRNNNLDNKYISPDYSFNSTTGNSRNYSIHYSKNSFYKEMNEFAKDPNKTSYVSPFVNQDFTTNEIYSFLKTISPKNI